MSLMKETLTYTQSVLIKFLSSLPSSYQWILSEEAQKNLKVHYQAQDEGDLRAEEEEQHTIVNTDDIGGNPDTEIPPL